MCYTKTKNTNKQKKKINKIYPIPDFSNISTEVYKCGHCNQYYGSNKIKIYCDGCEQFFHCHIAGSCIGLNCTQTLHNGKTHSSRYCLNCVNTDNQLNSDLKSNICICKKCEL